MIRFKCMHCGNVIEVADTDAGKEGDCRGCGKRITVPRPVIVHDNEIRHVQVLPVLGNSSEGKPLPR